MYRIFLKFICFSQVKSRNQFIHVPTSRGFSHVPILTNHHFVPALQNHHFVSTLKKSTFVHCAQNKKIKIVLAPKTLDLSNLTMKYHHVTQCKNVHRFFLIAIHEKSCDSFPSRIEIHSQNHVEICDNGGNSSFNPLPSGGH